MDDETKKMFRTLGYVSTVGLTMAFSIGIGAFTGYYLDNKFDSNPLFLFIFLGFGIAAAFRNLYIMYKRIKDL